MRKCKLIAGLLAVSMTAGSIGILPVMAEDDPIVYTYTNEAGETVNITQSELDAEHWDKDLLGENAPTVYHEFPMSIDKFVNDIGEITLDLVYMKKLNNFSSVSLSIEDLNTGSLIYSEFINTNSFYSPKLGVGTYVLTVTEALNEKSVDYKRVVNINKTAADIPDNIISNSSDQTILIASVDDISQIMNIDDEGEILIDNRVNPYTKVLASELEEYCKHLMSGETYRIYILDNNEQYTGFIDGDNDIIYDYNIIVSDYEALNTPAGLSTPSSISFSEVQNRASDIGFEEYTFKISDGSTNTSKYRSFMIELTDYPIANINNYSSFYIKNTIRGDVSLGVYLWLVVDGTTYPISLTAETGSTTRNISIDLKSNRYGINADSDVQLYGAIYFPNATLGYGSVYSRLTTDFVDDVTGSFYEALQDTTTPSELTEFREYNINSGIDVDVFYLKSVADCYKVSIRNRSTADQAKIDNGQMCNGSKEKYLYIYSGRYSSNTQATNATNVLDIGEDAIYAVPKNADLSAYTYGSDNIYKYFAVVKAKTLHSIISDNYQISYVVWGDNSVIED